MARTDVHREMKEMFGEVIGFVDLIPDEYIDSEWDLLKRVQFGETHIPNKYKELIGLARPALLRGAATASCSTPRRPSCSAPPTTRSKRPCTTPSSSGGWSTYINGMQVSYDEFKAQVDRVVEHVKATAN